jgi:Right handed beta helix region
MMLSNGPQQSNDGLTVTPVARLCANLPAAHARRVMAYGGLAMVFLITVGCAASPPPAKDEVKDLTKAVYASPGGWTGGDGSKERPYDLATALSANSPIRPGGTVWLRGGTYKGAVASQLTGTEDAPITVRPMPGEHVTIDAVNAAAGSVLTVNGAWTLYRDFEITNSDPKRTGAADLNRVGGIDVHGANTKLINLVLHDLGAGIGMWSDAINAEAYGNIIYYNGWVGADRAHGHGIYTQNKTGIRLITDNVVFGQFGIGIHAYGSEEAFLDYIQLQGNAVFNNGITGGDFNILLGGHILAKNPVLKENYTYDQPGAGNDVGYAAGCANLVMKDNYFANVKGGYAIQLVNCKGTLEGNVLFGNARGITGSIIETQKELAALYPKNNYAERQAGVKSFVRPNRYEPGRAHIIVYNWDHAKEVKVDLSAAGLKVGSVYKIRDVRNLSQSPVASGTYSGRPVSIRVDGLTAAPLIGWTPTPPHTAPEFVVFLLTSANEEPSMMSSLLAKLRGMVGL